MAQLFVGRVEDGLADLEKAVEMAAKSEDDELVWYPNVDGLGTFGGQRLIATYPARPPESLVAADIDGVQRNLDLRNPLSKQIPLI